MPVSRQHVPLSLRSFISMATSRWYSGPRNTMLHGSRDILGFVWFRHVWSDHAWVPATSSILGFVAAVKNRRGEGGMSEA